MTWRADPLVVSVVQPWLALRNALLHGVVQVDDFPFSWEFEHRAGPLRSCADSARRSGVDFDAAACRFSAFGIECALLTSPAHQVRDFLLAALATTRLRRLAARRPTFGSIVGGIDRVATLSFDNGAAPESRKAALRVVQTGGAITQSIAARWVHGG